MSIANELITRGWAQGQLMDEKGRVCLFGAAACAAGLTLQAGQRAIYEELGHDTREGCTLRILVPRMAEWNDAPERTFDEVLRVAKEADEILGAS